MRPLALCCVLFAAQPLQLHAQGDGPALLQLLDVPFISQSEALCGGAAAAMVLRYWGERALTADDFAHLVDRSAGGIRTDALVGELRRRGWMATGFDGAEATVRAELSRGRPVVTLVEDRPATFHYVVVLAWHDRAVVFHDPARAPFRVMSPGEFSRRWQAARRWMAVVVPGEPDGARVAETPRDAGRPKAAPTRAHDEVTACEQAIARGVKYAQANDLDAAERVLAAAAACPGATGELAGVRVLQKRWAEASDLAASAVAADARDEYAWKVLATSRFVQNDRRGALAAWNRTGEPRLDLIRIDGLTRTRHRPVEQLLKVAPPELLTPDAFTRAQRQLAELPSAWSTRLEYVPVVSGLAELRAYVAERPLLPTGRLSLLTAGLVAAATRELRGTTGSLVGGGEQVSAAWRFWPRRPRLGAGMRAPAPWGGTWGLDAFSERQPFTDAALPAAQRAGAGLAVSDWLTARVRWDLAAGVEEWRGQTARGRFGTGARWSSVDGRFHAEGAATAWSGPAAFATVESGVRAIFPLRPSTPPAVVESQHWRSPVAGVVVRVTAHVQAATPATPLDLWWGGDTGHVRPSLLRAHPLIDDGRLRVERLGRAVAHASVEVERWWALAGPVNVGAALFGDTARTAWRRVGPPLSDVDVGFGGRLGVTGVPGVFQIEIARGLRDGAAAISVSYQP